jgi:hypothetical protein
LRQVPDVVILAAGTIARVEREGQAGLARAADHVSVAVNALHTVEESGGIGTIAKRTVA